MKDIKGFEGFYAVTEDGRVWSHRGGKFMQPCPAGKGYVVVTLSVHGVQTRDYIHRFVAQTFLPNPENKPTVNHKDGNKKNNAVSNLEWATQQEQITHALETGLNELEGEANGYAKLDDSKVLEIRAKYATKLVSHETLADQYGVTRACILDVVRGRTWGHLPYDEECDISRWKDRGATHGSARWSAEQVREMRLKYANGGHTTRSLAEMYGGHHSGVWNLLAFNTYADQDHDLKPKPTQLEVA